MENPKKLDINCILLVAGASLRMGFPKQLIKIDGETLFRHSLNLALRCCKRVIVVQGAVDISTEIPRDANVELLNNTDYLAGQLGSLKIGLTALHSRLFFVFLADLILVKPKTFFHLAKSIANHHVVYPECHGRQGHPVLMDRQAAKLIAASAPDKKAMNVIQPLNPVPVPVHDRGIFTDIDTTQDLKRVRALFRRSFQFPS